MNILITEKEFQEYTKLKQENNELKQQLQSYKQKEDKLRELVEENKYIYYTEDEAVEDCVIDGKYILQILNEGE